MSYSERAQKSSQARELLESVARRERGVLRLLKLIERELEQERELARVIARAERKLKSLHVATNAAIGIYASMTSAQRAEQEQYEREQAQERKREQRAREWI